MNENLAPAPGDSLMAALRLWQARVDSELTAAGFAFMTGPQGQILHMIAPGGTPEADLRQQDSFGVDITPWIESLIRGGALIRENDPAQTLRVSDLGQRGIRAGQLAVRQAEQQFEDSLAPAHADSFREVIRLLQNQPSTD